MKREHTDFTESQVGFTLIGMPTYDSKFPTLHRAGSRKKLSGGGAKLENMVFLNLGHHILNNSFIKEAYIYLWRFDKFEQSCHFFILPEVKSSFWKDVWKKPSWLAPANSLTMSRVMKEKNYWSYVVKNFAEEVTNFSEADVRHIRAMYEP